MFGDLKGQIINKGQRVKTPLGDGEYRRMERLAGYARDRYLVRIDNKEILKEYNNKLLAFWSDELTIIEGSV